MTDVVTPPSRPAGSTLPLAWVVALVVGGLLLLVVVALAFSTSNTRASVDGPQATYSEWVEGD